MNLSNDKAELLFAQKKEVFILSKENEEKLLDEEKNPANIEKISNKLSDEEIDKLVEAHFLKIYSDKSLEELLEEGMEDIRNGRVRPFDEAMADIRKKLGFTT